MCEYCNKRADNKKQFYSTHNKGFCFGDRNTL